jgi:hypothetical protein
MGRKRGLLTSQKNKRSVLHGFNNVENYEVYTAIIVSECDMIMESY